MGGQYVGDWGESNKSSRNFGGPEASRLVGSNRIKKQLDIPSSYFGCKEALSHLEVW